VRRPSPAAVLSAIGEGRTSAELAAALQCTEAQTGRYLAALRARGAVEQVMTAPLRLEWRRAGGRTMRP